MPTPSAVAPRLAVAELLALIAAREELAVLDVRELRVHIEQGHILLSAPLPLSQLELRVASFLPRHDVRIVVYDGGTEGLAERASDRLRTLGWPNVSVLDGGMAAWAAAGQEVYTGVHVLSKAFGEFVEHTYDTPRLSARDLKAKQEAGEDLVVLDGRTLEEFESFSIPGAWACPNAELPYRVHGLVRSPETLVVVNCAGRTRSIIGAQALRNAGLANKVVALENGTMAWLFEGFTLNKGTVRLPPAPTGAALEQARATAEGLRRRYGIRTIDRAGLAALQAEAGRTVYRLDVRTRAEYEAGHLPGSLWAEGGQLVQQTDDWVAVNHARLILIDDTVGGRAAITASWLVQLGWTDVHVYALEPGNEVLEVGPEPQRVVGLPAPQESIGPAELKALLDKGQAVVLDFSTSTDYARGHVPGARYALRSRLAEGLARLPAAGAIVVTAADPSLAELAAADLKALTSRPIQVLAGGLAAWRAAGHAVEKGETAMHDPADDIWPSPYRSDDRFAAFQRYLDWEIGLVAQLARDKTVSFKPMPA
ncbi:MAG: rhodanese-like domain-containing protein [Reyranellaceae bacterium]